jgi:Tol biopolymer transport system component
VLQTFDRAGTPIGRAIEGPFTSPRLAPDQRAVAVSARDAGENSDVWVIDLVRGVPSRVTSHGENDWFPIWMPNGRHVLFGSTRTPSSAGANAIFRTNVTGNGTDELVQPDAPIRGFPDDVSADGEMVLFHNLTRRGYDLGGASLVAGGPPVDFLSTPFNEVQARFSPDGKWVAYASDESGRFEVYLRSWPSGADRTPVSLGGGMQPEWRGDGKELFYLSADKHIVAAPITVAGTSVTVGAAQTLFSVDVPAPVGPFHNDYAATADGQRFVVTLNGRVTTPQTLTVVTNWTTFVARQP